MREPTSKPSGEALWRQAGIIELSVSVCDHCPQYMVEGPHEIAYHAEEAHG